MSQLNPNAAEFVPVSPTRSIPSPLCRSLLNDEVIAQSPSRAHHIDIDISLPNPKEFEKEVRSRPSEVEVDSFNGHSEELNKSSNLIDNILNGKNIDDIPEFQPGSTPKKNLTDEFHFGPNAVQFTPAKLLDQSEAGLSTKAVYGDESTVTLGTSFNESAAPEVSVINKDTDPMSMSYCEERDYDIFDPNKVQRIPDNIDELLKQAETQDESLKQADENNSAFNDTISDLPEHDPLGKTVNNDDAIQVTDLDKQAYDDEKELASPLEPEKELYGEDESEPNKTPEPTHENLLGQEFCCLPQTPKSSENLSVNNDAILSSDNDLKEGGVATEVEDLLKSEITQLPADVEIIPPELASEMEALKQSPVIENLESDLVCQRPTSKSPVEDSTEEPEQESKTAICDISESKSPVCERPESVSPVCDMREIKSTEFESLVCDRPTSGTFLQERPDSESPVCEKPQSLSPMQPVNYDSPNSPASERPDISSPVCERPDTLSPVCERPVSSSPVCERPVSSPVCERPVLSSPVYERPQVESPICPLPSAKMEFQQFDVLKSPIPNETNGLTLDFTSERQIEEADKNFNELCRPSEKVESPHEDITSSVKDDVSSPATDQLMDVGAAEMSGNLIDTSVVTSEVDDSLLKHDTSDLNSTRGEEIDVKTDKIAPQYAEQAVITPSEESKQEEIPALVIDEASKQPEAIPTNDAPAPVDVAAGVAATVAAAATATAAAVGLTPDTKTGEKKKTAPTSATKKTTPKVGSKPPTPKASPASATSNRLATSKTAAPKPGAPKPPISTTLGSKPGSASAKQTVAAKPKAPTTTLASSKLTDRKPLANGDVKSTVKSTLMAKKETTATKTTATKSASSSTKLSPNKPTTLNKTSPTPRPASAKITPTNKPFTARPAPPSNRPTSATTAPKRPTTLTANKAPTGTQPSKTASTTSTVTAKTSTTKTSPRTTTTASKPKPPATSTTASKPRVPLTRTIAKAAPDTEKQNKESANKLTASKSVTGATSKTALGTTRTVSSSSTVRRVESKTTASRTTVAKTSTTTMKSTNGKKPAEIVRNPPPISKPKTTKIEKPKENGESTTVVEELTTVVHATNNSIALDDDTQLIKDNSPLDNKLIIDSLVEPNAVVD